MAQLWRWGTGNSKDWKEVWNDPYGRNFYGTLIIAYSMHQIPFPPTSQETKTIDEQNSVKGNQKGRPCGGLPSKPSCVSCTGRHPFSSYYKQST